MRHTNKVPRLAFAVLIKVVCLTVISSSCLAAKEIQLSKRITSAESLCLRELLREDHVYTTSVGEIDKLIGEASVARADLQGNRRRRAFIFVVEDIGYCGSAGCMLLIGERRPDGKCHLLAGANGAGGYVTVLRRRDHGYRRLYAPCELYFDGTQYQQVREECPNANVWR